MDKDKRMIANLRGHQPPTNVSEQIANLRAKGLIIEDEEYARATLLDISYFRLIKAYSLGLKTKNGDYFDGVRFEDIVQLYLFNSNFRQVLFPHIERIEVNLRCRLSSFFCEKYGVLGHENMENFALSNEEFQIYIEGIEKEINRNTRSPFIKNFHKNYVDGKVPFYALVEIMSFGALSKFFKAMKSEDKKKAAAIYGVSYTYLESWFESLSHVRNICAHYGRLYNTKLTKAPRLYKQHIASGISNYRAFAVLIVMKHLLPNDRHWHDFVQTISLLIEKYPSAKLHRLGFPQDWEDVLRQ